MANRRIFPEPTIAAATNSPRMTSTSARSAIVTCRSLAIDEADVDELALEVELHRAAADIAPDRGATLERPVGRELARDAQLDRAAVLVLDVRELLLLEVALHDEAVEVLIELEDAEQRRVP